MYLSGILKTVIYMYVADLWNDVKFKYCCGTFSLEELIAYCNFFYIILASSDEFDETSIFK